jgi:small subunit ribosomal protein S6
MNPDLNEEHLKGLLGTIEEEIKKNEGALAEVKSWGKRNLAYTIRKFREGHYYQIDFTVIPTALKDMERKFRLNDNIIRFLVIRKEK